MISPALTDDFREFINLLIKHDVDFVVCGGHAVAFYGYPRMTMDFDILIRPSATNAARLMECLIEFGFGTIPQLKRELFEKPGTVFSLGAQPNQIDVMTSMSSQDVDEIFNHKKPGELDNISIYFVGYEDLLRAKREANRLKDQLDLEELQAINGG